ncbi:TetR/AcrR family transcriptional regulator [Mycobacterium sp. pV006]|uniref:TetR/AcrR family transcriptional regulator n=1 Tax=Mycobacterium sp. pV006 TaxID=3238983 RepID=UPI00351BC420
MQTPPTSAPPEPRRPGRPRGSVAANRDVTRERILDAATELFAAQGFHGTSVAEISARADIKAGALYHHIKSKEELLWEILRTYTGKALAVATSVTSADAEPGEKLGRLIEVHVDIITTHRREVAIQMRDAAALNAEHGVQLQALRQGVQDCWERTIEECWPDRSESAVRIIASGLLGMVNSLWYWYRPERGDTPDQIAEQFRALVTKDL